MPNINWDQFGPELTAMAHEGDELLVEEALKAHLSDVLGPGHTEEVLILYRGLVEQFAGRPNGLRINADDLPAFIRQAVEDATGTFRIRLWCPSVYAEMGDGACPVPIAFPDSWVEWIARGIDRHALKRAYHDDELSDEEEDDDRLFIRDGDRVDFAWYEGYGQARITINEDGTFEVDRDMPEGANTVASVDCPDGLIADSVEEYVEWHIEEHTDHTTTEWVNYYTWGGPVAFEFRDGSFHEISEQPV